jgi:integrase
LRLPCHDQPSEFLRHSLTVIHGPAAQKLSQENRESSRGSQKRQADKRTHVWAPCVEGEKLPPFRIFRARRPRKPCSDRRISNFACVNPNNFTDCTSRLTAVPVQIGDPGASCSGAKGFLAVSGLTGAFAMTGTVSEVIDRYLLHLAARVAVGDFSAHAYEDAKRDLRRFSGRYGQQPIDRCCQHDVTAWLDANQQWRSNHTRKRILGLIVRPFLWAEDEGLIAASPYRKPKKLRLRTRPRRPAEISEYVALMRHGSRPLRRALFFLRRTGARPCEMRALRWRHVNLENGYVWIEEQKADNLTDNAAPRVIGLDEATIRFLRNLQRQAPMWTDAVFLNSDRWPWKDRHVWARHLRRYADRLGLAKDLSSYCLRHLYGTTAVENGVGERQLADQMGHSNTRMVSWYAHTARRTKHLRHVAEQVTRRKRD